MATRGKTETNDCVCETDEGNVNGKNKTGRVPNNEQPPTSIKLKWQSKKMKWLPGCKHVYFCYKAVNSNKGVSGDDFRELASSGH